MPPPKQRKRLLHADFQLAALGERDTPPPEAWAEVGER